MPDYEELYNELKDYNEGLGEEDFSRYVADGEEELLPGDNEELNFD